MASQIVTITSLLVFSTAIFLISVSLLGKWHGFQEMDRKWSLLIRGLISLVPTFLLGLAFATTLFMTAPGLSGL